MADLSNITLTQEQIFQFLPIGLLVFFAFLFLTGLVYLIRVTRYLFLLWRLHQYAQMTSGRVVATYRATSGGGSRRSNLRVARVSFFAPDGREITFTTTHVDSYVVGTIVPVRYLPDNPEKAELPGASIFSGRPPTYFARLLFGTIATPVCGFFFVKVLAAILAS